ncbi:MAG: Hsp20/alpha crystallin family protein [Thermoguttaceae bacterium]|nr:Hsp20/alpha crystallin family protein [Thermoguttaceae bacterium]
MNADQTLDAVARRSNATELDANARADRTDCAAPAVDVVEFDDAYVVTADMPGVCDDGVDVDFKDGELTIYGRVAERRRRDDAARRAFGFEPKDYFRSFRVGDSIDADKIEADFCDGVLTLRLPKREEIQPRKIAVNQKTETQGE